MTSDGERIWAVSKTQKSIYVLVDKKSWEYVGHAIDIVGLTYAKDKLWAADSHNQLWVREPVLENVNWTRIGQADDVVGMTSDGERLWAADSKGRLWVREPIERADLTWTLVGEALDVTAMTYGKGKLWVATKGHALFTREPVLEAAPWKPVGHANLVTGLAFLDDKLWAVSDHYDPPKPSTPPSTGTIRTEPRNSSDCPKAECFCACFNVQTGRKTDNICVAPRFNNCPDACDYNCKFHQ